MNFLDNAMKQYKCCCGCMSVVTGTKIICTLTLIECFFSAVAWVLTGGPFVGDGSAAIRIVVAAYVAYLPLEGIKKKKSLYFIPYLFYWVISFIISIAACYAFSEALSPEKSELGFEVRKWVKDLFKDTPMTEEELDNVILSIACFCFAIAAFSSWFFSVIFKCYKYIRQVHSTGYDKMALPMNL